LCLRPGPGHGSNRRSRSTWPDRTAHDIHASNPCFVPVGRPRLLRPASLLPRAVGWQRWFTHLRAGQAVASRPRCPGRGAFA
jgi:hypothetical protein